MIGVCYRAPLTSAQEDESLIELTLKASNEITVNGILILRGLNGIKRSQWKLEKVLECIQNSFFTQHVLLPTSGDNILDLVMSNEERLVENLTVGEPFGTSDHCVIKWDMVIKQD